MTRSDDFLELEERLQTIRTQSSDIADRRKELTEFKNLIDIDTYFNTIINLIEKNT